jgi:hypothetical protein
MYSLFSPNLIAIIATDISDSMAIEEFQRSRLSLDRLW